MRIFLFGGPSHGSSFDTDEPFEVGDILSWTPDQQLARTSGPPTSQHEGAYVVVDFEATTVDGVTHRRAEPFAG